MRCAVLVVIRQNIIAMLIIHISVRVSKLIIICVMYTYSLLQYTTIVTILWIIFTRKSFSYY